MPSVAFENGGILRSGGSMRRFLIAAVAASSLVAQTYEEDAVKARISYAEWLDSNGRGTDGEIYRTLPKKHDVMMVIFPSGTNLWNKARVDAYLNSEAFSRSLRDL